MDRLRKFLGKMWLKPILHGPFEKIFGQNVAQAVIHGPCEPVIIRQIVAHEPFL